MEMMEKNELLRILKAVKPGLASKGIIEQFTHFIFSGEAVMTYNDEVCISHPLKTNFQCSVVAEDLYKTLSETKKNEAVKLEMENGHLIIKTGKRMSKLSTEVEKDAEKMIDMLELDKIGEWQSLPDEFLKALFLCMFSASKDMTKGKATCVCISNEFVLSTDDVRISLYTLPKSTEFFTLIPARSVQDLVNYDIVEVNLQKNWIHFRTKDKVMFSARIMEDVFPVEEAFDFLNVEGEQFSLPEGLKDLVNSVTFMAEGQIDTEKRVELIIKKDTILCKAQKSVGEIEDSVDFESNREFHFFINPFFLSQVLEKATTMTTTENVAYFHSDNFEHLISLPADEEE
jgi:hypothetical protein